MSDPSPKERRFMLCTGRVVRASELHKFAGSHIHIIGELCYMTDEGRRVTALAFWEVSTPSDQVPPVKTEIVDYKIGDTRLIHCRHGVGTPGRCTNKQRWEIGKSGIAALMDRLGLQDKLIEILDLEEKERKATDEPVS